jgi:outer membrane protein assembly factor BamB
MHAQRSSGWRLGPLLAAVALAGATLGLGQVASAAASAGDFYAYAGGTARSPSSCPQTSTTADECTLARALALVPAGGSVLLATSGSTGTYYGNFAVPTAGTSPAAPVTIGPAPGVTAPVLNGDAAGTVPCPTGTCRGAVLTVGSGVVANLSSVTITGGDDTTGNGGGIDDLGAVSLTGVTITGCQSANGGAVAIGNGASLTATSSTFSADSASNDGGAIDNGDGGSGTLTVTDSTFSKDGARDGGAIDNGNGGTGTLTVTGSTFSSDSASWHGGAIDNGDGTSGTGTLTVTGSTFSSDSSPHGGAIDNGEALGSATMTVRTSTFSADSTTTQGAAIANGDAGGTGSAVILNTTIYGSVGDAAIDAASGSVQIAGSIVTNSAGANCTGTITDDGYNLEDDPGASCGFSEREYDLVGVSPQLRPLANNGGPTQTQQPSASSPVLDQLPNPAVAYLTPNNQQVGLCQITDQIGHRTSTEAFGCAMGSVDPATNVPVVTSLSSSIGPAAGGSSLTIHGGNFAAGATVTFGSATATKVTVVSSTEITVSTPAFGGLDGAGTVAVTVTNPSGLTSPGRPADLYRYYTADWSAYLGGPAHTSYNPAATSISTSTISNLQPIWQWPPPGSPNTGNVGELPSPIVSNGTVYTGLNDGEMYAISEATQQVIWSDFLGFQPATTCQATAGIASTATVADDPVTGTPTVYVNAPDGYLYAINAATGAVEWKSVVGIPSQTQNDYYAWGSPAVANGKVYIGIASRCDIPLVQAGVLAFDQHSGTQLAYWDSQPPGAIGGSVWTSIAVLPDGNLVASTGNSQGTTQVPDADSVVVLDGTTLKLLDAWMDPQAAQVSDSDFGGSPTVFTAYPAGVATTMVGACNKDGFYYAFRADDLHAGPVWEHKMGAPAGAGPAGGGVCGAAAIWNGHDLIEGGGSPISIGGVYYLGSVQAINATTGKLIWRTGLPGYVVGTPSQDGGGVVAAPVYYPGRSAGGVYLLSSRTGAILKFISTEPAGDFAQPVFDGNDLLVGDTGGLPLTAYGITAPGQATPVTITPGTLAPGTTQTLTVTGTGGFTSPANVIVSGTAVQVTSVQITSPTSATVTVAVSKNAPAGAELDLTLTEADLTAYSCTSCLSVS